MKSNAGPMADLPSSSRNCATCKTSWTAPVNVCPQCGLRGWALEASNALQDERFVLSDRVQIALAHIRVNRNTPSERECSDPMLALLRADSRRYHYLLDDPEGENCTAVVKAWLDNELARPSANTSSAIERKKSSGHTPNLVTSMRNEAKFIEGSVRYMLNRAAERIEELEQERDNLNAAPAPAVTGSEGATPQDAPAAAPPSASPTSGQKISKQIEDQFPAQLPPDDYQFEFIFGVKLDYRDWQSVLSALRSTSPSASGKQISGIKLMKTLKDQRDGLATLLGRVMVCDQNANILSGARELRSAIVASLAEVPTYAQQLQNICDGLGITREELGRALDIGNAER